MISSHATWITKNAGNVLKEVQYSISLVVITGSDAKKKVGVAINECMNNNLPPN
jgi:hypothetical protein